MMRFFIFLLILVSCTPRERGVGNFEASMKAGTLHEGNKYSAIFYIEAEKERTESRLIKTRCVATAIESQLIITAAHCLYHKSKSGKHFLIEKSKLRFFLSGVGDKFEYFIPKKFDPSFPFTQHDYAFIILNDEIKSNKIEYLPLLTASEHREIDHSVKAKFFGYEADQPSEQFIREEDVPSLDRNIISVASFTDKGDSGGPLVVTLNDGSQRVAGVLSYKNYLMGRSKYVSVKKPQAIVSQMKKNQSTIKSWFFEDHLTLTEGTDASFSVSDWHLQIRKNYFESPFFNLFARVEEENIRGNVYLELDQLDLTQYPIKIVVTIEFKDSDYFGDGLSSDNYFSPSTTTTITHTCLKS